jgi:glycosyltransferase involved in cell wall biosynthesis
MPFQIDMAYQGTILYIMGLKPEKIGGMELFCGALAQRLLSVGWRVVFCFEGEPADAVKQLFSFPNVAWEVVPSQAGFSPRRAMECARLVVRYRPEVLIYSFNGVLRPYPWVAKLLGVRRIFYNDQSSRNVSPKRRNLLKTMAGRFLTLPLTGSLCVSDYVRRCELAEGFVPPRRIAVVYNGVDLCRVAAARGKGKGFREKYGIPSGKKVVVQVSWMVPVKGVDKLLQAARIALETSDDAHFVLVGDGSHRSAYMALSDELGIAQHVTWTGMVADPIGEGAFDAADIACLFSQWQDACPLAVVEAMSSGVPMIASNAGGLTELVADRHTGYVVDKDDVTTLAERILKLLDDSELRAQLGENARAWAVRRFDLAKTVDAYIDRLTRSASSPAALQTRTGTNS